MVNMVYKKQLILKWVILLLLVIATIPCVWILLCAFVLSFFLSAYMFLIVVICITLITLITAATFYIDFEQPNNIYILLLILIFALSIIGFTIYLRYF